MNQGQESLQRAVASVSLRSDDGKHPALLEGEEPEESIGNGHQAVTEKDGIRKTSPLPFPEHIIQVMMDIFYADKEEEYNKHEFEHLFYTGKSIEYTISLRHYDEDLKNLSLVSRLWNELARHTLGRKLVLIMNENLKELRAILRAMEVPLYGAWTRHVEILEVSYKSSDEERVGELWEMAQQIVFRLGNVKTFLFSSCLMGPTSTGVRHVLSTLKDLEELEIRKTFTFPSNMRTDSDVPLRLSIQSPFLRKETFSGPRCLPDFEDTGEQSDALRLSMHGASDFLRQTRLLRSLFHHGKCFSSNLITLKLDEGKRGWVVDKMYVSGDMKCGRGCLYEDPSGVGLNVQKINLVAFPSLPDDQTFNPACLFSLLRSLSTLKHIGLSMGRLPSKAILDKFPDVESLQISFDFDAIHSSEMLASFDERLLQFCELWVRKIRQIGVSSTGRKKDHFGEESFRLTRSFCSKHNVGFVFK